MNITVILLCLLALLVLVILFKNVHRRESFSNAQEYEAFNEYGRKEMCKVLMQDPDIAGSGLTMTNCLEMPLSSFNHAMERTWMCKKNQCGVVGVPTPETHPCVRECKQHSLLESLYSSSVFDSSL